MMIAPMPLMKPEMTGYGTMTMYLPSLDRPNAICMQPPRKTVVKASARPCSGSSAIDSAITLVMTTVIGPVGPEIWLGVPPKTAAKKPTMIAP